MIDTPAPSALALRQAARENPAAYYLLGQSAASRPTMARALRRILRLVAPEADLLLWPWGQLRSPDVIAIRAKLEEVAKEAGSSSAANQALVALRGVLGAAFDLNLLSADELKRCQRAARHIPGEPEPAGRMLEPAEIRALLAPPPPPVTPQDLRDRALAALALYSGLRRAELAALDGADTTVIGDQLRIVVRLGKGGGRRDVIAPKEAVGPIRTWMSVRGDAPGPLFNLGIWGIWGALRRLAVRSRVSGVTPHDLRRTFASTLLDRGVALPTVQRLMGHQDPATTMKYDRRNLDAAKRVAAEELGRAFGGDDACGDAGGDDLDPGRGGEGARVEAPRTPRE